MTPVALTTAQQEGLNQLVQAGRLEVVPVDLDKAERFLTSATVGCADLAATPSLSARSRHRLAYDAAHDAAEALLAAYGYRTTNGPGAHQALAAAVKAILDAPPPVAAAAVVYESLRQKRNQDHYRAVTITESEAKRATELATLIVNATAERLP